jgi:hypothetical protein
VIENIESKPSAVRVFWGEIAPSDHIAHFYDNDESFLIVLAGFIAEGLENGESTIVIATPQHLSGLEALLVNATDLPGALAENRYVALDAEEALASFMRDGNPDEELFAEMVSSLLRRSSEGGRRVRAFGEMVALLWAKGNRTATVRLEFLWNDFCKKYGFCLLCSYPKAGFTTDPYQAVADICAHHSRHLGNDWTPTQEAA